MSKRKRTTEEERSPSSSSPVTFPTFSGELVKESSLILQPGFYIVTSQGEVITSVVGKVTVSPDGTKAKVKVEEPIRCRTIAAAKDSCSLASRGGEDHGILVVTVENFAWGE